MGAGRFLTVFSRADAAKPDPTAYARERLAALVESAADDDAKARCETIIDAEGNGSGCVLPPAAPPSIRVITIHHIPVVRFDTRTHPPRAASADPPPRPPPTPLRSIAFEAPDPVTRRQRVPKVTTHEGKGTQVYCVARSAIKRTAKLGGILQWMGVSNDLTNPDFVPPNDAEIIMAHYRRMMARQRWTKANKALSALKAMNMAGKGLFGGAGGLAAAMKTKQPDAAEAAPDAASSPAPASPPPPTADPTPARPDSPSDDIVRARLSDASKAPATPRMSSAGADAAPGVAAAMGQLPKRSDVRQFLRELEGSWCFVIVDIKKDLVLAAMSDACESAGKLFAAVSEDGALVFGDDPATVPDAVAAVDFPAGTFYVGRIAEDVADVDFRRFAKETETKEGKFEEAAREPTNSAA